MDGFIVQLVERCTYMKFIGPIPTEAWAELLEACLALTSVKYHDNLLIMMLLYNQWLALTMLPKTAPDSLLA